MCYYNSVKVNQRELIRLKSIEKAIAQYDFLNKPLLIGFAYQPVPVLKRVDKKLDFDPFYRIFWMAASISYQQKN